MLPQSTAFAILGYDCGGILEQVYATGFDPSTGYPTGNVDLRTSCSTGRAGSPPSLHTASVALTWDFAGNVISTNTPATGVPANPTFIATDGFNDILYNAGANAYLIVPVPAAPTGVTAVQSGDQFHVAWTPNGVNPVAITSSTLTATPVNNSTASNLTTTVTEPVTNGVIPTLQPATSYQITVVSTTIGGSSPASTPISVTTSAATIPPSVPTRVSAQWASPNADPGPDTLVATWQAPDPGNSPINQFARDNPAWGYNRIVGALANLGYHVSGQTVGNILKRHGLGRAPERKRNTTWVEFIRRHKDVLWATDFFTTSFRLCRRSLTYVV